MTAVGRNLGNSLVIVERLAPPALEGPARTQRLDAKELEQMVSDRSRVDRHRRSALSMTGWQSLSDGGENFPSNGRPRSPW